MKADCLTPTVTDPSMYDTCLVARTEGNIMDTNFTFANVLPFDVKWDRACNTNLAQWSIISISGVYSFKFSVFQWTKWNALFVNFSRHCRQQLNESNPWLAAQRGTASRLITCLCFCPIFIKSNYWLITKVWYGMRSILCLHICSHCVSNTLYVQSCYAEPLCNRRRSDFINHYMT